MGAQRRLVADASHELRTPLTSLMTNLELLAENPADPQAPALVGEALAQTLELKALINDLVDLARFGESAPHTEDVRLDVVAVAPSAGALMRLTLPGVRPSGTFPNVSPRGSDRPRQDVPVSRYGYGPGRSAVVVVKLR